MSLFFIFLLLTFVPLFGQTVRFVAFDLQVPAGHCKLLPDGDVKRAIDIELGISRFGKAMKLTQGNYLLVLPDGKTNGKLVIKGEANRKLLIIVFPGAVGHVKVITAPDETARFGPGDRFFINATQMEVRIRIGEKNLVCKSGTSQIVKPPKLIVEERLPVRMAFLKDKNWHVFNSTWWPANEISRSVILLYPNETTGVPSVKTIEEIPHPER